MHREAPHAQPGGGSSTVASCPPRTNRLPAPREVLDGHGIDEPTPVGSAVGPCRQARPAAAGPDPDSITVTQFRKTVPGGFPIARVAQALKATTAHVIYLLSRHLTDWSPRRLRHFQHTAAAGSVR